MLDQKQDLIITNAEHDIIPLGDNQIIEKLYPNHNINIILKASKH